MKLGVFLGGAVLLATLALPLGAFGQTNVLMGNLGCPIRTEITIEGTPTKGSRLMGFFLKVYKVNEKRLAEPLILELALSGGSFNALCDSNIVCRLRGREEQYTILPLLDPKTGSPMQQHAAGTFSHFVVSEIINPIGFSVENGNWKKSDTPSPLR